MPTRLYHMIILRWKIYDLILHIDDEKALMDIFNFVVVRTGADWAELEGSQLILMDDGKEEKE